MKASLCLWLCAALVGCRSPRHEGAGAGQTSEPASSSDTRRASLEPADYWLASVGSGPSQTNHVCARGAQDRVSRALCVEPRPEIDSLESLYQLLGLVGEERLIAATTHSLGLSVRTVSAANPRSFVFVNNQRYSPMPYDKLVAVSFARGEQLVEMVALDTVTYDWNFYVLAFTQDCNQSRCTPADLLSDKVEKDWNGWTLYSDHDLLDTPLDCTSCHQPEGAGTHKLLLMRQFADPWLHWGDFRGVDETANCSQDGPKRDDPGRKIPGEGLDLALELEGEAGQLAGLPIAELHESKSGRLLADLLVDATNTVDASPYGSLYQHRSHEFDSARILCELLDSNTSTLWQKYRAEVLELGLPAGYPGEDVMVPSKRAELLTDRAGYWAAREQDEAFDVANSLLSPQAEVAVGVVPEADASASQLLRQMCVRCHNDLTPPGLRRALFNAERIDELEPASIAEVVDRIRLPRHSPQLMPPLRSGELPPAAIERIEGYLMERCGKNCQ